ncbi:DUF2961 domain-containing protein, partial [bacterium]|nr:DUF2961 domain-containing protein [bacterium]
MKHIFLITLFLVPSFLYPATDVGLAVYDNIENLPKINPLYFATGFSSYERNGGNVDRGKFLYQDGSEYVMADIRGPGSVYRLWTTGQDGNTIIRFYLDGAAAPQINLSFNSFYNGITSPFLSPLNGDWLKSSGGFYSYLPITFSNSCRITTTDNNLYYNVGMMSYPALTNVDTWTGSENSSTARAMGDNVGNPVGKYTDTLSVIGIFNLAAGEENQL